MSKSEIGNFYEYFTTQVNTLNKKQIVKSVIDDKMLRERYSHIVIYVCDNEECFNIMKSSRAKSGDIHKCDCCNKQHCIVCPEFIVCKVCRKTSCQQGDCYEEYTQMKKTRRGKGFDSRCSKCEKVHQTEMKRLEYIKKLQTVEKLENEISNINYKITYLENEEKGGKYQGL